MFLKRSSLPLASDVNLNDSVDGQPQEKSSNERRQEKIEKRAAEQKKETEKERIEKLEFLKFPNIMGWYFDGTFTKDFTLHEEYAEYFNEIEDELDAQRDLIIEETFTEKAYRNFWPPVYTFRGKHFRTRGIYLDFKEVKEDPPKTPPNINYEKQRGVIGVELGGTTDENDNTKEINQSRDTYGEPGHHSSKDNWYWAEQKRDFKPKEADGDYIWSDDERIWRENDPTYRTPYDWYFDEKQGRYFIRDRSKPELYTFDQEKNIYKIVNKGPSSNGLRHNDYYYDERQRMWLQIGKTRANLKMYLTGAREVVIGDRGKSGLTQDDFYYDGETGKMELKDEHELHDYFYDVNDKMFKKKNQSYGPGKADHYPHDYEFDQKIGKYHPLPAKERRHVEAYDWYFDMDQGKYFRIDRLHRDKYVFDTESCVYKLKDAKGPSANELGPDDYYWDENSREWKLVITLKDPSNLQQIDSIKRKVLPGDRGKSGKIPDDFYYDAFDGSYFRKDQRKPDAYWYDTVDEVWKKRGQHYGPGYFQLYPFHYYFDYDEGFWFPTTTAKQILAKQKRGEVKGLSDLTPYDYAFVEADGDFQLRDKMNPRMYKYNPQTGVFHKEGPKGTNKKEPKDYFYDEFTTSWLPLEHPKGHEARAYNNGKRNNRVGPRGKSGKIPDDYYFSFTEGQFLLKDTEKEYEYLPNVGVWKWKEDKKSGSETKHDSKKNDPTEFYFDKEEGAFVLKKKLEYGEIALNPNTNLWMQRWRCPPDYYWEPRQNKYLRKTAAMIEKENYAKNPTAVITGSSNTGASMSAKMKKQQEEAEKEMKKRNRDYERPWLHHYLEFAADEIRFEQELLKQTKRENPKKKTQAKKSIAAAVDKPLDENGDKAPDETTTAEPSVIVKKEQTAAESGKKKKHKEKRDKKVTIQ